MHCEHQAQDGAGIGVVCTFDGRCFGDEVEDLLSGCGDLLGHAGKPQHPVVVDDWILAVLQADVGAAALRQSPDHSAALADDQANVPLLDDDVVLLGAIG